ncbi:ABC transporter substrate-binding protein [Leptolyngbya sp. 15MV]|nr:ABC transporter substrate-binding protein [Leptolyngbya sp. 15MV]
MDRRSLVASVTAGMATLIAPSRYAAAQQHRVNQIVATVSFAFLPLYVAEHAGFFREEGVQLNTVRVQTAAAGMAAVVSGDGHYYVSTPATGARAAAQGADVQVFAALMQQYSSSVVLAKSVADRLGITPDAPLERRLAARRRRAGRGRVPAGSRTAPRSAWAG